MELRPSDIRYSQDSIGAVFSDSSDGDLLGVFEDLVSGTLEAEDLGRIEVGLYNGEWVAFEGNRRLFLFKKLEEAGLLDYIEVKRITPNRYHIDRKYTTENGGTSIRVRRAPFIHADMKAILRKYQRKQVPSYTADSYDNDLLNMMRQLNTSGSSRYPRRSSTSQRTSSSGYSSAFSYRSPSANARSSANPSSSLNASSYSHTRAAHNTGSSVYGLPSSSSFTTFVASRPLAHECNAETTWGSIRHDTARSTSLYDLHTTERAASEKKDSWCTIL